MVRKSSPTGSGKLSPIGLMLDTTVLLLQLPLQDGLHVCDLHVEAVNLVLREIQRLVLVNPRTLI